MTTRVNLLEVKGVRNSKPRLPLVLNLWRFRYMQATSNARLIVPLSMARFAILIVVPLVAARSRLLIPGYVGLVFLASMVGLLCGRISGIHGIAGTPWDVLLSLLFFY